MRNPDRKTQQHIRLTCVAAALMAAYVILTGCGDDPDNQPAPSPGTEPPTTPTAPATETPKESASCELSETACEVGTELLAVLNSANVGAFAERLSAEQFECSGEQQRFPDEPFPLCEGAGAGEIREGYVVASSTHGSILSLSQLTADDFLKVGTSDANDWRILTAGCGPTAAPMPPCQSDATYTVVSGEDPDRYFLLRVDFSASWKVTGIMAGPTFQEPLDDAALNGGQVSSPAGHSSFQDLSEFIRWSP